jgi:methionyl aminopeptidase
LQKLDYEITAIAESCKIVAETLELLAEIVEPGMKTSALEKRAVQHIKARGAVPSFKGYMGYPGAICISINDEVVHGIPGDRVVEEGDIVSFDVGAYKNGFHGDSALTVAVGDISADKRRLMEVTEESLFAGISKARAGNRVGDISAEVQKIVEREGFSVVKELVGHGIGRNLHEDPKVPNYGHPGTGMRLKKGMTIAIEPMVNIGSPDIFVLDDEWTIVTRDGSPSAHFEHTVLITDGEALILTERKKLGIKK